MRLQRNVMLLARCAHEMFKGGAVNTKIPITELTISDIKQIFPTNFIRQLDHVFLCGNYGDPMMGEHTLDILNFFRSTNSKLKLGIYTNGSGRNALWWKKLASLVDYCQFAIDGLEDTNAIYRRGSSWPKVIDSASHFIHAGGNAEWAFLAFKHNENQIESAAALSKKMGFSRFIVRRTNRFFSNGIDRNKTPIKDKKGVIVDFLQPTTRPEYINPSVNDLSRIATDHSAYESYIENTDISCLASQDNRIYISAEGYLFPCCYTAHIYSAVGKQSNGYQISTLLDNQPDGVKSINAKIRTIEQILDGEFFTAIPESWYCQTKVRLRVCAEQCGKIQPSTSTSLLLDL